jgi:hypothetical protein
VDKTTCHHLFFRAAALKIDFAIDNIKRFIPRMGVRRRPSSLSRVMDVNLVTARLPMVGEDRDALGENLAGSNGIGIRNDQIFSRGSLLW